MDCSRAQQSQASDEVDKTTAVVEKQQHSRSKQVSKDVREGEKTGAWKCTKNQLSRYLVLMRTHPHTQSVLIILCWYIVISYIW